MKALGRVGLLRALGLAVLSGAVALGASSTAAHSSAVVTGCAAKTAPPSSSVTPITIVVSVPLTGQLESIGRNLRDGIQVAESQINAAGGLLGRPVRFNIVDDGSQSDQAIVDVIEPALVPGVVGLIGPLGSGQTKAVHELTRNRKIPQISLGSSVELTTLQPARDRYLFRTSPADDLQAKAVVKYAQEGPAKPDGGTGDAGTGGFKACSKFGVVYIDNSYGQKLEEAMRVEVAARGGKVVYSQVTAVEKVGDYAGIVKALLAAQPECLVLVTYVDVAAAFLEALRKVDPNLLVLGTDGLYADDLVSKSRKPDGTSFAEGVVGTNPDTTPETPAFNEFKILYRTYHNGGDPGSYAANAYDAAILYALAILAAGSATDTVKIRDALFDVSAGGAAFTPARYMDAAEAVRRKQDVDYKGASGSVDFDEFGDVKGGFIVWGVQGDKLVTIRAYTLEELGQ